MQQLSSMLERSGRDVPRDVHEVQHHQQSQQHQYPHPHPRAYQPQLQLGTALSSASYSNPSPVEYTYQQRVAQSPPSPPAEEVQHKPSLPSISSLLGIADGERVNKEAVAQIQQQQAIIAQQAAEQRAHSTKMALPPTPPMQAESTVDENHSPSAASAQSTLSGPPYYLGSALNNLEPFDQRQTLPSQPVIKRHSLPSQTSASPYGATPYGQSPYGSPPASGTAPPSYYSPNPVYAPSPALYGQRPLPSNFPPQPVAMPLTPASASAPNPWQHHHYISASSAASFPQSQDRYICPTCNKAFSRPSSLRIHSHSHTGEKPFKCPHTGCGKAFSVRSNMKRHERGCHASSNGAVVAV